MWFDRPALTPEAIRHLAATVGADRIPLGSDDPYPWQPAPADHVLACNSLSYAKKIGVLGANAAKLLNIPT